MRGERAYRALLLLYPRRFRREYRDPMLQLYRDERRARGARAGLTIIRDLFVTVPVRHLEAFSTMTPQSKLVAAAIATTVGIAFLAAVGGSILAIVLLLLLAWILLALLKQRGGAPSAAFWWKLTASGAGIFVLAFVFFAGPWPDEWREAVPGELAWWGGMFVFMTAIVLVIVGLLTGVAQLIGRRRLTQ